jgi:preprotein translocase subunit SecA
MTPSAGLRREEWHPPRGLLVERAWLPVWRERLRRLTGAASQQTEADLRLVRRSADQAQGLAVEELQRQLRQQAERLRYASWSAPETGSGRAAWFEQRAQLLGLWCVSAQGVLGLKAHDTQIRAALEMHNGHLVQLAPGEGKTLAIGLAAALYASAGRPCHVITANDYLAARDAELMQPLLAQAGWRAVAVTSDTPPEALAAGYAAEVVYATGKQLLADHLRDDLLLGGSKDPMRRRLWEMSRTGQQSRPVGRGLWAAIVDEADSVLIDEATTPLIISSADDNPMLVEAVLAGKQIFESLQPDQDYVVKTEPVTDIRFTEAGKQRIEDMAFLLPPFWRFPERSQGMVSLAIMARHVYQRDRHYLVDEEGKVVIVDEKSGRVMAGRSWSHGIHQAIEAMEGLALSSPPKTSARMTFQTFFNRYHRLCGASGTLHGIHGELRRTYGVQVVAVAPRVPSRLQLAPWRCFAASEQRMQALIDELLACHERGLPVLVGTRKLVDTERLSDALALRQVPHQVLNAKHHAEEARIVARAGQWGAVTVSTNMAGRGTDIMVPPDVAAQGGLQVLMLEPHEATRIEWQLYGRSGRQGAPGSAARFVCLYDELLVHALGKLYVRLLPLLTPLLRQRSVVPCLVWCAQAIAQWKAASQRQRLAERERKTASQLSFSD